MKIPLALAKAVTESFPTLVCEWRVCFRIRLTHATGGSNSTADGGAAVAAAVGVDAVAVLASEGASGADDDAVVAFALLSLAWFSLEAAVDGDPADAAVVVAAASVLVLIVVSAADVEGNGVLYWVRFVMQGVQATGSLVRKLEMLLHYNSNAVQGQVYIKSTALIIILITTGAGWLFCRENPMFLSTYRRII